MGCRIVQLLLLVAGTVIAGATVPPAWSQSPIRLVPMATAGLDSPLFATTANDGSGRLFIVEQGGKIRVLKGALEARPFLDISSRVLAGGERGLLGLAFHPAFATNRRLFVDYTRKPDGAIVVSEFQASADRATALPASERPLMVIPHPFFANHNGGMLAFGRGGALFVGVGDGGGAGDPFEHAQNPRTRLGKILRINVDAGQPFAIPPTNPFARGGGRPEIFALGFRNPFRFSFDRLTGALFVGDVGQARFEEIDVVGLAQNYGWPRMEGGQCFRPATDCITPALRLPIATYGHDGGRCSVTGGYVYRGSAIPALYGTYLFADFCTGEIFGLIGGQPTLLLDTDLAIASFAENRAGELLVVDLNGTIQSIVPAMP